MSGASNVTLRGLFCCLTIYICSAGTGFAQDAKETPLPESCFDLWVERNTYYAQAGYCFKTTRAKEYFSEAMKTCSIHRESEIERKLSKSVLRRIAAIIERERAYGCN